MYNDKVMKHFQSPINLGELKDPDAVGVAASPVCGDILKIFLKVKNGVIQKATFKTMGCSAAIAASSILTELLTGKPLEEVKSITGKTISDALGGLPPIKMHCPDLAAEALKSALADLAKRPEGSRDVSPGKPPHRKQR